ncbi:MAG: sulfatase-like hydrolase/transferase, partial [Phycisphaeraceae bacterium]
MKHHRQPVQQTSAVVYDAGMKKLLYLLLLACVLPALAEEKLPQNVLFIIADDLAANALGCYGNEQVQTPKIDNLAKRGVLFERVYSQHTVCGPARAALLSGL